LVGKLVGGKCNEAERCPCKSKNRRDVNMERRQKEIAHIGTFGEKIGKFYGKKHLLFHQ